MLYPYLLSTYHILLIYFNSCDWNIIVDEYLALVRTDVHPFHRVFMLDPVVRSLSYASLPSIIVVTVIWFIYKVSWTAFRVRYFGDWVH